VPSDLRQATDAQARELAPADARPQEQRNNRMVAARPQCSPGLSITQDARQDVPCLLTGQDTTDALITPLRPRSRTAGSRPIRSRRSASPYSERTTDNRRLTVVRA
jgi:hypothetical protein